VLQLGEGDASLIGKSDRTTLREIDHGPLADVIRSIGASKGVATAEYAPGLGVGPVQKCAYNVLLRIEEQNWPTGNRQAIHG
jgi:hypothetical protein